MPSAPDARQAPTHSPSPRGELSEISASSESIAVWFQVTLPNCPRNLNHYLRELAQPDFSVLQCHESAQLSEKPDGCYRAHWYCSFALEARDRFAAVRLLKRLAGAGFDVLRYDSQRDF